MKRNPEVITLVSFLREFRCNRSERTYKIETDCTEDIGSFEHSMRRPNLYSWPHHNMHMNSNLIKFSFQKAIFIILCIIFCEKIIGMIDLTLAPDQTAKLVTVFQAQRVPTKQGEDESHH
jgi:hypothetical protein